MLTYQARAGGVTQVITIEKNQPPQGGEREWGSAKVVVRPGQWSVVRSGQVRSGQWRSRQGGGGGVYDGGVVVFFCVGRCTPAHPSITHYPLKPALLPIAPHPPSLSLTPCQCYPPPPLFLYPAPPLLLPSLSYAPSPSMSISPPSSPSPSPPSIPVPISNPNPTNPPPPPPRKVPPPCWTPDETFALVHAYRDRWFSLRRRNLRSPDWDAVAEEVSRRCPGSSPPKSSVQCRHKIEKLRKRYRSEKQRSLAYPGRFSSSWDLFPLLDSMEIAVVGSSQDAEIADVSRFRVKALPDRSAVPQGIVLNKHGKREDVNSSPNLDYEGEFGVKVVDYQNLVTTAFGSKSYAKAHHFDPNSGAGYGVQIMGAPSSVPGGIRLRNQSKVNGNYSSNPHFDYSAGQDIETGCGFPVKSLGNRNLMPQGFRSKNYDRTDGNFDAKLNHSNYSDDYGNDKDGGFYPRIPSDRLVPSGFRSMNYSKVDGSSTSNVDSGMRSGSPSSRLGFGKNGNSGGKRKMDPVAEMVSSIKMLGEGFVRMEKMKMEMAREIEKMRMEAEMKRNEMIIKSQQQIVDVFVNALFGKKKKVKMEEPHS